ncbi:RcpC/CpaB family pilus assembly protein [Streptomyces sp. NPDC005531]|uniref:RcpC/CpaB family pilus assembly protein n=2 Tax=unclassified Streptomyces TaxID=2593676 RepID=UPI0036C8F2A9
MFPPVSPSTSSSDLRPTVPGPPVSAPPPCGVPAFAPLRVRGGGGRRLRRAVWRQRRAMAAGLALTAAALAATGLTGGDGGSGAADGAGGSAPEGERRPVQLVSAPVRIADAATVRLLRPGDRVDVIAGEGSGADARVVAKGAKVAAVPRTAADGSAEDPTDGGALVVLSVPRSTAASLAGAGISARLAVTLC